MRTLTLESDMNIELDEVVVQDVSDDALELAAGGAQGGHAHDLVGGTAATSACTGTRPSCQPFVLAIADR
jgi:hypothetical protein